MFKKQLTVLFEAVSQLCLYYRWETTLFTWRREVGSWKSFNRWKSPMQTLDNGMW